MPPSNDALASSHITFTMRMGHARGLRSVPPDKSWQGINPLTYLLFEFFYYLLGDVVVATCVVFFFPFERLSAI